MASFNPYQYVPIGSLSLFIENGIENDVALFNTTPSKIHSMLSSSDTGAYIQGIGKSHKIPADKQPAIAFVILKIAIGKVAMADFTMTLSSELGIDIDEAQKMATEIYRDLFAPIQDDLDAFLANPKKDQEKTMDVKQRPNAAPHPLPLPEQERGTRLRGASNILDLKELSGRPEEKELPAPKPAAPRVAPVMPRTVDLKNPPAAPVVPPKPPVPPAPPKKTFPLPPVSR